MTRICETGGRLVLVTILLTVFCKNVSPQDDLVDDDYSELDESRDYQDDNYYEPMAAGWDVQTSTDGWNANARIAKNARAAMETLDSTTFTGLTTTSPFPTNTQPTESQPTTMGSTSTPASTTSLPSTTAVDHCADVTCTNGGSCINTLLSFSCSCISGYEGTHCEQINYCVTVPCPPSATCHPLADGGRYCLCQEGYRGDACEEVDVLVSCTSSKQFTHVYRLNSDNAVVCFNETTTESDLCYDPDDQLLYDLEIQGGPFVMDNSTFCLYVSWESVSSASACENIVAKEKEDLIYDRPRLAVLEVCVVFNTAPVFNYIAPVYYNVPDMNAEPETITLSVTDREQSTLTYIVLNINPTYFDEYISIDPSTGVISVQKPLQDVPGSGLTVSVSIQVTDGDTPQLTATDTVEINFRNVSLLCLVPSEIVYGLGSSTTGIIATVTCSETAQPLAYEFNVNELAGTLIVEQTTGQLILQSPITNPRNYSVEVLIRNADVASTVVSFTVMAGYFEPQCDPQHTISISEKKSETCTKVTSCHSPYGSDPTCAFGGAGGVNDSVAIQCDGANVTLCIISSLDSRVGIYPVSVIVSGQYGSTEVNFDLAVINVNDKPVFQPTSYAADVSELGVAGEIVLTVAVSDPDVGDTVTLTVKDSTSVPFDFQQLDLVTTASLNVSEQTEYNFVIVATDGAGASAEAMVHITVLDVNEPPRCDMYPGLIHNIYVDIVTQPSTTLTQLQCLDGDTTSEFSSILYEIDMVNTPLDARNLFGVSATGIISTLTELPGTAGSYKVVVIVRDGGGLSETVTVNITINSDFPPVCTDPVEKTISEKTTSESCFDVDTGCTDPTVGEIQYILNGLNGTNYFQTGESVQDSLQLCTTVSLDGLVGEWHIRTLVSNTVATAVITVIIIVEDENDPPVFFPSVYSIAIPETSHVGITVMTVTATDVDSGTFGEVQYSLIDTTVFSISIAGVIYLSNPLQLNTDVRFQFQVLATDGGNLTASATVTIDIGDVNQPPSCDLQLSVSISLTTTTGTDIGIIPCSDNDRTPLFSTLVFTVDTALQGVLGVNVDGHVIVEKDIPRNLTDYTFSVGVRDQQMESDGDEPISVTVIVSVERVISPICDKTAITGNFNENDEPGQCLYGGYVECYDPTGGDLTNGLLQGTGQSLIIVRKQTEEITGVLSMNICPKDVLKGKIGQYNIQLDISNGLAVKVISWTFNVIDVNDNPEFSQTNYTNSILETVEKADSIIQFNVTDPDVHTPEFQLDSVTHTEIGKRPGEVWPLIFVNICCFFVIGRSNATKRDKYEYVLTARDKGGLTSTAYATLFVEDVNESPICNYQDNVITIHTDLYAVVGDTLHHIDCFDTDRDVNFKTLTYNTSGEHANYFDVNSNGDIILAGTLSRLQEFLWFTIDVRDGGGPPLGVLLRANVKVDIAVPAECSPVITYPDIWVMHKCFNLSMNCHDPTMDGTTHLTYEFLGNYTGGFSRTTIGPGVFSFCYIQTRNDTYRVQIRVHNQLAIAYHTKDITVEYSASTPRFTLTRYDVSVSENIGSGTSIVQLEAVQSGNRTGSIGYSIIKVTGYEQWFQYFEVHLVTGLIVAKQDFRPLAGLVITLEAQAKDEFSQLKSVVNVVMTVVDENEMHVCTITPPSVSVRVSVAVGSQLATLNCTDPDVVTENKHLEYSVTNVGNQENTQFFQLLIREDNTVGVEVKTLLSVTTSLYNVTIYVTDSGTPPRHHTWSFILNVSLLPPAPIFTAYAVNSSAAHVEWKYSRAEYLAITRRFILVVEGTEEIASDVANTKYLLTNLMAQTTYTMKVVAETNYGNVSSEVIAVRTPEVPIIRKLTTSIKMTEKTYSSDLENKGSYVHVVLADEVRRNMQFVLNKTNGFVSLDSLGFRKGSVIADSLIRMNQTANVNDTLDALMSAVRTGWIGDLAVDPGYFIYALGEGYIRVREVVTNIPKVYNGSAVDVMCRVDLVASEGTLNFEWTLNGAPVRPTAVSRIVHTPGATDSILQFDPILTEDEGTFGCFVEDKGQRSSSGITEVTLITQPSVKLTPLSTTVSKGQEVNLTCEIQWPRDVAANLTWYQNGVKVPAGAAITYVSPFNQLLTLTDLQVTTRISCESSNEAGTGVVASSEVGVISDSTEAFKGFCERDIDSFETIWEITAAGSTNILDCKSDMFEGVLTRVCDDKAVWLPTDNSRCIRIRLRELVDETNRIKDGIMGTSATEALTQLSTLTDETEESLTRGELELANIALDNVVVIASEQQTGTATNDIDEFMQSASNILDPKYKPEWEILLAQEKKGASGVMQAVSDYVRVNGLNSPTDLPPESFVIAKSNLVAELGRTERKDIIFPDTQDSSKSYPQWLIDRESSLMLPKEALNAVAGQLPVEYSIIYYRNISDILPRIMSMNGATKNISGIQSVNSDVMGFSMVPKPSVLRARLEMTFKYLSENFSDPVCSFWDFSVQGTPNGAWADTGCEYIPESRTASSVTCACSHATNFAVLMSPGITPPEHELPLSIISAVGCAISLICLCLTIIVYFMFWRFLKADRAMILMNLCVALIIAYALFLGGVNRIENKAVCTAISALLHYIYLVVFFLMLAEGIEIAVSVLYVFSTRSRLRWLLPLSWVTPAFIVGISLGATQLKGYGSERNCWLSVDTGLIWAFLVPALVILLINFVIVILVLRAMMRTATMLTKTTKQKTRSGIRSICILLPIMGFAWVFGVFSVSEDLVVFQYLFAVFNTLQGLFIFLLHCVFNRQVRDAITHNRKRKRSMATMGTSQGAALKLSQKSSDASNGSLEKQNNQNQDIDRRANPFLEADRQVQQIVDKIRQSERNNAYSNIDPDKVVDKDYVDARLEDIKISNIVKESEDTGAASSSGHLGTVPMHFASTGGSTPSGSAGGQSIEVERDTGEALRRRRQKDTLLQQQQQPVQMPLGSSLIPTKVEKTSEVAGRMSASISNIEMRRPELRKSGTAPVLSSSVSAMPAKVPPPTFPKQQQDINSISIQAKPTFGGKTKPDQVKQTLVPYPKTNVTTAANQAQQPPAVAAKPKLLVKTTIQQFQQHAAAASGTSKPRQDVRFAPGVGGGSDSYEKLDRAGRSGDSSRSRDLEVIRSHPDSRRVQVRDGQQRLKNVYSSSEKDVSSRSKPDTAQKKSIPRYGKAKDLAVAKKLQQQQREPQRFAARQYPVDYYAGPPRHPSLENMAPQFVQYQPFNAARGYYPAPWEEPSVDYW